MIDLDEIEDRINYLLRELAPLARHSEINVRFFAYDIGKDVLYMNIQPCSVPMWAETAYKLSKDMKYDRDYNAYGIDGQPRVSGSGLTWVRFIGDFVGGSKVGLHVWSDQSSHSAAEEQLMKYYQIHQERDGKDFMDVFRDFMV